MNRCFRLSLASLRRPIRKWKMIGTIRTNRLVPHTHSRANYIANQKIAKRTSSRLAVNRNSNIPCYFLVKYSVLHTEDPRWMDSKCFDPAGREREPNRVGIEPVGDVLDGGVGVERSLHGRRLGTVLASLAHPLFSPADQRADGTGERRRGASAGGGAGVRNSGTRGSLVGLRHRPDTEDWPPAEALRRC